MTIIWSAGTELQVIKSDEHLGQRAKLTAFLNALIRLLGHTCVCWKYHSSCILLSAWSLSRRWKCLLSRIVAPLFCTMVPQKHLNNVCCLQRLYAACKRWFSIQLSREMVRHPLKNQPKSYGVPPACCPFTISWTKLLGLITGPIYHEKDSALGALLFDRSSSGLAGLIVLPAVIDADFTGEIMICAYTLNPSLTITKGTRIA